MDNHVVEEGHEGVKALLGGGGERGESHVGGCGKGRDEGCGEEGSQVVGKGYFGGVYIMILEAMLADLITTSSGDSDTPSPMLNPPGLPIIVSHILLMI